MAKKNTSQVPTWNEAKKEEGAPALNCDPLVVFQDIRKLILDKYQNIKISELELALAWYIMDLDITVNNVAPEAQNVDMYNTIDKMLFATDGARNTIVRILSDIELLNNEIEKHKKENEKKHHKKND